MVYVCAGKRERVRERCGVVSESVPVTQLDDDNDNDDDDKI